MQNLRNQDYNIPFGYSLSNCQGICLDLGCSDTMRLIPSEQWKSQFNKSQSKGQFLGTQTCFLPHNHQQNIAKIEDILEKKYENIKSFQSNLKKLQDFTEILVQIENSFTNMKQFSQYNFQDQQFQVFCTNQAQKISTFYQQLETNYFQEQLRNFLIKYQDNNQCYKQLNQNINQLIQDFNFIEKQIYSPIVSYLYKGMLVRNMSATSQNVFEFIIKFSNQTISLLNEILRKIIQSHANKLENITYLSLDSFQYFQIIVRILKKYFINFLQPKDKQNIIDQLIKYSKYFFTILDMQNALICFKDSLEINSEISDLYLQLAKIFKKQEDLSSIQKVFCLGLYYFPQKIAFLSGLLESCGVEDQQQVNLIKNYQFQITQKENNNEFLLLAKLFESINMKISSQFQLYQESNNIQELLSDLRTEILAKNMNSKNLNPIKKLQVIYESKKNSEIQITEPQISKLENIQKNSSLYEQFIDLITPQETHSNVPTQLLAKTFNPSILNTPKNDEILRSQKEPNIKQKVPQYTYPENKQILQKQQMQKEQKKALNISQKKKIIKKVAQSPSVKKLEVIEIISDDDLNEEEEQKQSLLSTQSLGSNNFSKDSETVQNISQNVFKTVNYPEKVKNIQNYQNKKQISLLSRKTKENSHMISVQQYLFNTLY